MGRVTGENSRMEMEMGMGGSEAHEWWRAQPKGPNLRKGWEGWDGIPQKVGRLVQGGGQGGVQLNSMRTVARIWLWGQALQRDTHTVHTPPTKKKGRQGVESRPEKKKKRKKKKGKDRKRSRAGKKGARARQQSDAMRCDSPRFRPIFMGSRKGSFIARRPWLVSVFLSAHTPP